MNRITNKILFYFRNDQGSLEQMNQFKIDAVDFFKSENTSIDFVFDDNKDLHQPKLQELLDSNAIRGYEVFSVPNLSHLPSKIENLGGLTHFLNQLSKESLSFVSVTDGLDTRKSAMEFLSLLLLKLSSYKKELKSERAYRGLMLAKESGKHIGRPFSYDHSKIFELHKAGLSHRKISEALGISKGAVQHALSVDKS